MATRKKLGFEPFAKVLFKAYSQVLAKTLPPKGPWAKRWQDPSALTWMGLAHEQEYFYVWFSFGLLKPENADAFVRANQGAKGSDYLESTPLNAEHYRFLKADLQDALLDHFASAPPVDGDEDEPAEEDDEDAHDQFRRLAALTALGLCALQFGQRPRLTPMKRSKDFALVLADDLECATWQAKVPRLDSRDRALRERLLDAHTTTPQGRALLAAVMALGDKKSTDFLPALAGLEEASRVKLT